MQHNETSTYTLMAVANTQATGIAMGLEFSGVAGQKKKEICAWGVELADKALPQTFLPSKQR